MRDSAATRKTYPTIMTEDGEVHYAEYTYRGITYRQLELTLDQEHRIGEILTELDIDNLRSLADLVNVRLGMFISAALKNRMAPRLLSIVLMRSDGQPLTGDEFTRGLAREFNPFFKEVAQDFFSLNSSVLEPITDIVRKVVEPFKHMESLFGQLKQSMRSLRATSQSGGTSATSDGVTH